MRGAILSLFMNTYWALTTNNSHFKEGETDQGSRQSAGDKCRDCWPEEQRVYDNSEKKREIICEYEESVIDLLWKEVKSPLRTEGLSETTQESQQGLVELECKVRVN